MFNLTFCEWIYIVSISFQLSGAVLLLIRYSFKNIEKGMLENKLKETRGDGETLILGKTQPTSIEYTENVWLNRIAFALITLGYLFGVFGDNNGTKIVFFAWILILSSAITTIVVLFAHRKAMSKSN